jgi:NAD-dependent deacetylase
MDRKRAEDSLLMKKPDPFLAEAALRIKSAKHAVAFTGAGISAESGIPPFRGEGGIWNTYDPIVLDIRYFKNNYDSWKAIKAIFYDFLSDKYPNNAHKTLANWELEGVMQNIITQNIDNLHQEAGCIKVIEYHGNAQRLICMDCQNDFEVKQWVFDANAPRCPKCNGKLKPDFIFFGERIPELASIQAMEAAENCDLMLLIGASGEVSPANQLPMIAARKGAYIIEVNTEKTLYTPSIVDLALRGSSAKILPQIADLMNDTKE